MSTAVVDQPDTLAQFHPIVRRWFLDAFDSPTTAQSSAWPAIADGRSTLLLAPTGSGKTLAAFLVAIDRIMFGTRTDESTKGVRVLYVSPLKALGVDIERNLRSPIAGVRAVADRDGVEHHVPTVGVRSGDTPPAERYRLNRRPPDILITTPESLYLILTSRAREILETVDTVIIDEIHSMVGTKRGAHLFVSLERLERLRGQGEAERAPLQRIGLSATQRPLDEVARLLGGAEATANAEDAPRPRPVEIVEAGRSKQLDLKIEAPPSIASGIQRIGRAGHQVGVPSSGIVFPKYRGDLLACGAAAERMVDGHVEATYYPRNPLDVLAQQLVAMVATGPVAVDRLYLTVRCAAPFHDLPRSSFDGVLDLLAGRYPSDEFSELRPRINWDRIAGTVAPRKGTQRVAVLNAGTIPDRGLYGVFLAADGGSSSRVGELDEEMVFETHVGDVFLLGASSWRVLDITNDRVLVAPAPGESGKMPFWKGDGPGRPLEFGRAIGRLARRLLDQPRDQAESQLAAEHDLDQRAATNLLNYLHEQAAATGEPPSDKTIIVECFLDEVGDWRIAVMSPFGARVHAPWAMAVAAKLRAETPGEVDMLWSDDGMVFRLPESDEPPSIELLFPRSDEIEDLVVREVGSTAQFAARFRENAARALLLPRRRPGRRTPLWLQRRRAGDLLSVAARYADFPIILETYRECLRDVFDIKGLTGILQDVERRTIRVRMVRTKTASPFASLLMFNYTANFIYDGDAPLAERRAQTLALDHAQLRELLGDSELRELLDADAVDQLALELQRLDGRYHVKHEDALHELLLHIGDLTRDEIALRCDPDAVAGGQLDRWLKELTTERRIIDVRMAGESRYAAAEDAARFRDALGVVPPAGLPNAFLASVAEPLGDLVSRYARTHVPFKVEDAAARFGLGSAPVRAALDGLATRNRVLEGEFLPGGQGREWCDAEVLRTLKRRSLARLRKQVEPVEPEALARFQILWQGLARPAKGLDGLLDVIEQLQGLPLPASTLERDILPGRINGYQPSDLDELCAAGEVVWRGFDSLGTGDGRIALYLADHLLKLAPQAEPFEGDLQARIRNLLAERGALFFEDIATAIGGFRNDVFDALWDLVWAGEVTNDTLAPFRSLRRETNKGDRRRRRPRRAFRSRRTMKTPGSEGRWSLLVSPGTPQPNATERQAAIATQLIDRYGILTREMVSSEGVIGGFAGLYPVFKAMEEAGKIRRGYFVAGLGAAQFAASGADDRLRERRTDEDELTEKVFVLAATDPANPYGAALSWPRTDESAARPQRAAGARVVLHRGSLIGYLGRTGQQLISFLPESEPERGDERRALVGALAETAAPGEPVFLTKIDGLAPGEPELAQDLSSVGFTATSRGYLQRGVE